MIQARKKPCEFSQETDIMCWPGTASNISLKFTGLLLPLGAGGVLEETQGGCSLPVQGTGGFGRQALHP